MHGHFPTFPGDEASGEAAEMRESSQTKPGCIRLGGVSSAESFLHQTG